MLQVSELPVTRWPPGADVDLHWPAAWMRYLAFIVAIYGFDNEREKKLLQFKHIIVV